MPYKRNKTTELHRNAVSIDFSKFMRVCDATPKDAIDELNENGDTALVLAIINYRQKNANYLIDNGADLELAKRILSSDMHRSFGISSARDSLDKIFMERYECHQKKVGGPLSEVDSQEYFSNVTKAIIDYSFSSTPGSPARLEKRLDDFMGLFYDAWLNGGDIVSLKEDLYRQNKQVEFLEIADQALAMAIENKRLDLVKIWCTTGLLREVLDSVTTRTYIISTAILSGDIPIIKFLVTAGMPIDPADKDYYYALPLFTALGQVGLEPVIKFLLKSLKVDPNSRDKFGEPALHCTENLDYVDILLENGADINIRWDSIRDGAFGYDSGGTPIAKGLYDAKTFEKFKLLMKRGASLENINRRGDSVLHLLAKHRRFAEIKELVEQNRVGINCRNKEGQTPLFSCFKETAAGHKPCESFEILLSIPDIELDAKDSNGNNIMHHAHRDGLKKNEGYVNALLKYCTHLINQRNTEGKTPLHLAAENCFESDVLKLVKAGGDLTLLDKNGNSPMHIVLKRTYCADRHLGSDTTVNEIEQLIKQLDNLTINAQNSKGKTLLHIAAEKGLTSICKLLIERGANPRLLDSDQKNATFYALTHGNTECFLDLNTLSAIIPEMLTGDSALEQSAAMKAKLMFPQTEDDRLFSIRIAMNAMLFTRWSNTKHYEQYKECIGLLITKFGEDTFIAALKELFDSHLRSLDLENLEEQGPHTDINPYPGEYMNVARFILDSKYPLWGSMRDCGYLVNLKTIFGDKDFWEILKTNHPKVYVALLKEVHSWPEKIESLASYSPRIVEPLKIFKLHFPDAFGFIEPNLVNMGRLIESGVELPKCIEGGTSVPVLTDSGISGPSSRLMLMSRDAKGGAAEPISAAVDTHRPLTPTSFA